MNNRGTERRERESSEETRRRRRADEDLKIRGHGEDAGREARDGERGERDGETV